MDSFLSRGLFFERACLVFRGGLFGESLAVLDWEGWLDEEGSFGPRAYMGPFFGDLRHSFLGCFSLNDEVALVSGADVVAVHGFLLGFSGWCSGGFCWLGSLFSLFPDAFFLLLGFLDEAF